MTYPTEISSGRTRAMLVAVKAPEQNEEETKELLLELEDLTRTYGAEIVARRIVKIIKSSPRYLIGSGNVDDILEKCREQGINLIIIDNELTPSQQRNWENLAKIRVIDRHEVILDIFAVRASTREAALQIELAKADYMLPRLKRAWTHLSRQQGGVGVRGEGEKQIEVDARMVRKRISKLKKELQQVRKRRAEQRKKRQKKPVPNVAIVGYTNAGKSSLLNCITQSTILVEDKLFATLDPTTRRIRLSNNQVVLLTDTVGFVRKLPHDLIEAFKATLEEAVTATFLIHVVDVTGASFDNHMKTTIEVLTEIGAGDKYVITVFNKIDLVKDSYMLSRIKRKNPDALFISTKTDEGIPELLHAVESILDEDLQTMNLRIPQDQYEYVALLHRTSKITAKKYEDDAVYITASVPENCTQDFAEYVHPK